jgi:heme O synthase-like polyprenyltransferase
MALLGLTGWLAAWGSLALGACILALGWRFSAAPTYNSARRVFLASVAYLPLILGVIIADRSPDRDGAVLQPVVAISAAQAGQAVADDADSAD